jgi:hypothetical protein
VSDDHRRNHMLGVGVGWRQGIRLYPGSLVGPGSTT